jgi:hypothetical protein
MALSNQISVFGDVSPLNQSLIATFGYVLMTIIPASIILKSGGKNILVANGINGLQTPQLKSPTAGKHSYLIVDSNGKISLGTEF